MSIKYTASIHSARVDRDGEWTLTLKIPLRDGVQIAKLTAMTQTSFDVDMKESVA